MEVDGEHSVVGVERQIDAERRLVDAGVVDEDVDRPDRCLRLGEQRLERLGLRQVPAHPVDRGPELGHLLDVHRGDLRAFRREPFSDRAADPVRARPSRAPCVPPAVSSSSPSLVVVGRSGAAG